MRSAWEEIWTRFDPERPVDRPEWRAVRERDPAGRVHKFLDLNVGDPRVLLTASDGAGKSTELRRIAEARADREFVVCFDLLRHYQQVVGDVAALQRVGAWEVCLLAGIALVHAARENLGYEWDDVRVREFEAAWRRAVRAAEGVDKPEVDTAASGRAMYILASRWVITAHAGAPAAALTPVHGPDDPPPAKGRRPWLPSSRRRPLSDHSEEAHALLGALNQLIGELQHRHRRVLLVVDGLDQIRDAGTARALFVETGLLARLACRLLVAAPFASRHHPTLASVWGTRAVSLANEPVLDPQDPRRLGPGLRFFVDLFRKRTADLVVGGAVEPGVLEKLAYYSGGRAGDFVRLVRLLAEHVMMERVDRATEAIAAAVVDDARRVLEAGLHAGHIALLEQVASDARRQLPASDLAWELLRLNRLLVYPEGSEWFYPHPLLMLHLVRPAG